MLISGCSNDYELWNEVEVPNVGLIKIPKEWVYNENNNIVYFAERKTDNLTECHIYMMGIIFESDQSKTLYKFIDETMKYERLISSEAMSNSATIGEEEYSINGKLSRKYFLDLYSTDKIFHAIALDDSVEYGIIKKIGASYVME